MRVPAPVFVIARVLLALMFVLAGLSKFADLGGAAAYVAGGGLPMPDLLAFLTATLEVVGGVALIVGFQARMAALALALFTLAANVLFHKFWAVSADQQLV